MEFQDKSLRCVDCGDEFIWTAGEQLFFADKQFKNEPKRCKACKAKRASRRARVRAPTDRSERVETQTTARHAARTRRCRSVRLRVVRSSARNASSNGSSQAQAACKPSDILGRHRSSSVARREGQAACLALVRVRTHARSDVGVVLESGLLHSIIRGHDADRGTSRRGRHILDLKGKMTLGEGDEILKDKINSLVLQGRKKLVLNLADVPYIDSAGLGEIVRTYTTVSRQGGSLAAQPDQAHRRTCCRSPSSSRYSKPTTTKPTPSAASRSVHDVARCRRAAPGPSP